MAPGNNRMDSIFRVTDKPPHIYLDSLYLVREVKKHRVIYDLSSPKRNLFAIFAAWETVNAALVPLYHFLKENDKFIIRRNIRKRWTWMRGVLRRDMSRLRLCTHIRLRWMQEMQFLVPLMIARRNKMNRKASMDMITPPPCPSSSATSPSQPAPSSTSTLLCRNQEAADSCTNSPRSSIVADELNEVVVQKFVTLFTPKRLHSQTDPDKNFLFALLQLFRKLPPEQKITLKEKIESAFPE